MLPLLPGNSSLWIFQKAKKNIYSICQETAWPSFVVYLAALHGMEGLNGLVAPHVTKLSSSCSLLFCSLCYLSFVCSALLGSSLHVDNWYVIVPSLYAALFIGSDKCFPEFDASRVCLGFMICASTICDAFKGHLERRNFAWNGINSLEIAVKFLSSKHVLDFFDLYT